MAKRNLNLISLIGIAVIILSLVISYFTIPPLEAIDNLVYDVETRWVSAEKQGGAKIALVEIDERSTISLGPWPWPRQVLAEMVEVLKAGGAKVIGLDVPFTHKESGKAVEEVIAFRDRFSAFMQGKKDPGIWEWVQENLKQLEEGLDNDRKLIGSVEGSGNVILPALNGSQNEKGKAGKTVDRALSENSLAESGLPEDLKARVNVNDLSLPLQALSQAAAGIGYEERLDQRAGRSRSHLLFVRHQDMLLPSFPLRMALAYLKEQPKQVVVEAEQIRLKGFSIPHSQGEMLIRPGDGEASFPRFSFVDLIRSKKAPPSVKDALVFIGFGPNEGRAFQSAGVPGTSRGELVAQILENILARSFIARPSYMPYAEMIGIILLGGIGAFFFPRMGQVGRLGLFAGLLCAIFGSGIVLLSLQQVWFKGVYVGGSLLLVYLSVTLGEVYGSGRMTRESIETNRLLGLSFQSQGLLDLAFEKFRKLPLDKETKDLIFNLGLEFEQRRMINKALVAYEYINKEGGFRDLDDRIPKLRESDKSSTIGSYGRARETGPAEGAKPEARKKVGRYEIIQELGRGAMGLVYKAVDPKINRLLAIKTIRFSDEFDEDVIQEIKERFFREAEIAGKLSHPSIVTVYDLGDDRDLTYMAMEFLEGDDLEKFTKKGSLLPFRKVLDVVGSVADALDFAHQAGVVHRDIKPANIMVLIKGGVKVTDFGIAKAISSSRTKTGVILGTPNYMSPEQIMGQRVDARSDIFSLGVLFFQLITGELPFRGENLSALLYQITQVKHPPVTNYNPKVPKICAQIIDRALAKNPEQRFKTAGEMAKYVKALASKMDDLIRKRSQGK